MDDLLSGLTKHYPATLSSLLRPTLVRDPLVLDLFAGAGGLALGFEARGFETQGYELDGDACRTYGSNLAGACERVELDERTPLREAPVIVAGPPCQPFSVGGLQGGTSDVRNGFPAFVAAVERLRPEIWLFENVRGLLYRNRGYFAELSSVLQGLGYVVEARLLNAVRFGVPQNRERLVVVGHRGEFRFPGELGCRVTAGEALGPLAAAAPEGSKFLTASMDDYVARYERASKCARPRDLHLDRPARTLTARNLAGATGDMHRIRLPDGRRRRLGLREAARLQSFPDWFSFAGGETSQFTQVGNAVAPLLSFQLAGSVRDYLASSLRLSRFEVDAANRRVGDGWKRGHVHQESEWDAVMPFARRGPASRVQAAGVLAGPTAG